MKRIIIILILLLLFLTPIQASNHLSLVSTEYLQTQVMAQVQENYTIEIEKSLDFGIISKRDPIISKKLNISLWDVIPNESAKIEVKLVNNDLKMWDEEREHSLSLKASQTRFDFELKDYSQSLDLSINPNYITAAGNYKAVLDFEINYISHQDESLEASPSDWFIYDCSQTRKVCDVKSFSPDILSLLESDGIKEPVTIRIPQEFAGKAITGISSHAFTNEYGKAPVRIQSVYFPDTIIKIGASSFYNQPLKELKGGSNLEVIDSNAFNYCYIKHLRLKDKVKTIGLLAFRNNPIEILELPLSIDKIAYNSFDDNSKLSREIIIRYNAPGYENNQMDPLIATHEFKGYKLENNDYE